MWVSSYVLGETEAMGHHDVELMTMMKSCDLQETKQEERSSARHSTRNLFDVWM